MTWLTHDLRSGAGGLAPAEMALWPFSEAPIPANLTAEKTAWFNRTPVWVTPSGLVPPIILARSARFDVAQFQECPVRAQTGQPRATPWDHGNSRVNPALKGRHKRGIVRPLQGQYPRGRPGVIIHGPPIPRALPWADLWKPLRGDGATLAQHQNLRFGLVCLQCHPALNRAEKTCPRLQNGNVAGEPKSAGTTETKPLASRDAPRQMRAVTSSGPWDRANNE